MHFVAFNALLFFRLMVFFGIFSGVKWFLGMFCVAFGFLLSINECLYDLKSSWTWGFVADSD